jgi:hypothetical protein
MQEVTFFQADPALISPDAVESSALGLTEITGRSSSELEGSMVSQALPSDTAASVSTLENTSVSLSYGSVFGRVSDFTKFVAHATFVLGLLLASALFWIRFRRFARDRVTIVIALLCGGLAFILVMLVLSQLDIPIGMINVLHEGGSSRLVPEIFGWNLNKHNTGWMRLIGISMVPGELFIRTAVQLNIFLSFLNLILLCAIAYSVSRNLLVAAVLGTITMHSTAFSMAMLSSSSAPFLGLLFLLGVVVNDTFREPSFFSKFERAIGLSSAFLIGVIAVGCRVEVILVALPAFAILLDQMALDRALTRKAIAAVKWATHFSKALRPALIVAMLIAVQVVLSHFAAANEGPWKWVLGVMMPSSQLGFLWSLVLMAVASNPGFLVLELLGLGYLLRHPVRTCLLGYTWIILAHLYVQAGHNAAFEIIRYNLKSLPALALFGLLGWMVLERVAAARSWHRAWRVGLLVLLLLGEYNYLSSKRWLSGLTPGGWSEYPSPKSGDFVVPNMSNQSSARWILNNIENYPECIFVLRPRSMGGSNDDVSKEYLVFGTSSIDQPFTLKGLQPKDLSGSGIDRLFSKDRCVLFYRGLDCNLVGSDGCLGEIAGADPVAESIITGPQYSDKDEYGLLHVPICIGLYTLPGFRRPAQAQESLGLNQDGHHFGSVSQCERIWNSVHTPDLHTELPLSGESAYDFLFPW